MEKDDTKIADDGARRSGDDAIRLFSKMFSRELGYDEKIGALRDEFHISVTREMSGEVLDMCNLSTGVFNKGYESGYGSGYDSGYDLGRDDGIAVGRQEERREVALQLHGMGMPPDRIAMATKADVGTVRQWLEGQE